MASQSDLDEIRSLVATLTLWPCEIGDDTPLLFSGLVESISVVKLILDLERMFGVRIPARSVQPSDFNTVRLIATTVDRFRTS